MYAARGGGDAAGLYVTLQFASPRVLFRCCCLARRAATWRIRPRRSWLFGGEAATHQQQQQQQERTLLLWWWLPLHTLTMRELMLGLRCVRGQLLASAVSNNCCGRCCCCCCHCRGIVGVILLRLHGGTNGRDAIRLLLLRDGMMLGLEVVLLLELHVRLLLQRLLLLVLLLLSLGLLGSCWGEKVECCVFLFSFFNGYVKTFVADNTVVHSIDSRSSSSRSSIRNKTKPFVPTALLV